MSEYPSNCLYTKDHEWVAVEGDVATIGITDYAQGELDAITFIELPAMGDLLEVGGACGTIEAVKVAEDIFSPVAGEVVDVNGALEDEPEIVNNSPFDDGWFFKVKLSNTDDLTDLMDKDAYLAMVGE
ncbi:MAG: glycine cleavage system protein GcvH [bacterium]|nr:glycine cleavage system protein GcvH [bacterium]